jgi:hypothetical protein
MTAIARVRRHLTEAWGEESRHRETGQKEERK